MSETIDSADEFDTIVLGTGLAESIIAASLAKASQKVLHLDPFPTYGGPRHSSLTIPELTTHLGSLPNSSYHFPSTTSSESTQETFQHRVENGSLGRQYALSLYPAVLPARGKLIDTLISSGVSGYVGFRIVDGVGLLQANAVDSDASSSSSKSSGKVKKVPTSKGQVFKDKTMSLLEKRKLMKMLMFVVNLDQDKSAEDPALKGTQDLPFVNYLQEAFGISDDMARDIAFGIAHCSTGQEPALPTLLRMQRYLRSLTRYSPTSSFLVAQFGGIGEIVQGFCRSCAVYGGTYILGEMAEIQSARSIEEDDQVEVIVKAQETGLRAKRLIGSRAAVRQAGFSGSKEDTSQGKKRSNVVAVVTGLPDLVKAEFSAKKQEAEKGEEEEEEEEAAGDDIIYLVVPPTEGGNKEASRVLFMGSGTGSCPEGQYVIYISCPESSTETEQSSLARKLVETFYPATTSTSGEVLFVAYYDGRESYEWTSEQSREDVVASDPRLIILDDAARGMIEGVTATGPTPDPEWLEGMDFEAELAKTVLTTLGVELINKQEEGAEEGDGEDVGM